MTSLLQLKSVASIVTTPIRPTQFPQENFELFSLPAYSQNQPDVTSGSNIKSGKLIIHSGQVLISKLNPRIPRVWYVPKANYLRQICSPEFIPIEVHSVDEIDPEWLCFILLSPQFMQPLQERARSSTRSHQRVRPEQILEQSIPKIPILQQRKMVEVIKRCFQNIRELEDLDRERSELLTSLKRSLVLGASSDSREWEELNAIVDWVNDSELVVTDREYKFAGIKSFGRGLFESETRTTKDFAYRNLRRLRTGDFIYPKLMAWEGAFAMVTRQFAGMVVSPEFVVFRPKNDRICVEVLDTYFRSPVCLEDVGKASTGSNRRRRRLNPRAFLTLKIPVPSPEQQSKLKSVYDIENQIAACRSAWGHEAYELKQSILRKAFAGEL
jgi:type I restriction enzyme S subunit